MTTPMPLAAPALDFAAADRWPGRAAAHVLGIGLALAVIAALPVAPTDLDRHQLPKESIVHIATWLAVMLARPFPPRGLRPAALVSIGLLLLATVVSCFFATNAWVAFRAASLVVTGCAALITARHLALIGHGAILIGWCGFAGVVGAGTGLAQAYGLQSPLFANTRLPGGTFGNRNFMAHFAALSLPIMIFWALSAPKRLAAIGATIGCGMLITAIVLTRSRAAWLGSAVATAVLTLACIRGWRRQGLPRLKTRALLIGGMVVAGAVAAIVLPNQLSWRSASPYTDTLAGIANHDDGSGHGRVLQYRNSLKLAARHPLVGVGPGNWPIRYADVAPPSDPTWVFGDVIPINPWPSSDWMALASEFGFVAVFAALFLGAALLWRGWRATNDIGDRVLAGGALIAMLLTAFLEGNLDAVLLLPAPLLFLAISTGALLQRCDENLQPEHATSRPTHRAYLLVPLVLGLITVRSILQTTAYIVAGSGRSTPRLIWAARIDPGSYPLRIALAQRQPCADAKGDILASMRMAPTWPAPVAAAARCGVRRIRP